VLALLTKPAQPLINDNGASAATMSGSARRGH